MIVSLHGTLVEKAPAFATLETGGVGYGLAISLNTYDRLPATGTQCRLLTYLHVRDDALLLFGFYQAEERQMFERLIGVSGIGPKSALSILSGLTIAEFSLAISEGDIKRISSVPGIGKKTAERLIIELRDKINPLEALSKQTSEGDAQRNIMLRDAIMALSSLGFSQDQARKMIQKALERAPALNNTEELLRQALNQK